MDNKPENKKESKARSGKAQQIIIILLILIIIAGATVSVIFVLNSGNDQEPSRSKGVVGVISDNWDPDVSKPEQSNEKSKGTLIPGYSTAEMKEGDTSLRISIGNPKDNEIGLIATLKLEDGTVLYTSPLLKPGQGMEEVPLEKTLSKGKYNASVVYQCVLLDEEQTPVNSAESGFELIVN